MRIARRILPTRTSRQQAAIIHLNCRSWKIFPWSAMLSSVDCFCVEQVAFDRYQKGPEKRPGCSGGVALVVRRERARPALAPHARPMARPGLRGDAAADPGKARDPVLRPFPGTLPDGGGPGRGPDLGCH